MAKIETGTFCPLIKKDCITLKCAFYTLVRGQHPQSGEEIDEWACAIAWTPILLINAANQSRQGAAAIESLRNKVVETAETALNTQIALAGLRLKPGAPTLPAPEQKDGQ